MITVAQPLSPVPWTALQKIAFRFFLLCFGLLIFPFPIDSLPFLGDAFNWYYDAWDWLIKFTGKHILHLPYDITVQPNGSGDTTWNYVQVFIIVMLSITGCLVWSIADWRRERYTKLFYWFNVAVRYYLAISMFSYGFIKIWKMQFPYPSIARLTETYGESSPMGLAWTFLGYSHGYNYFMGGAEVVGGLLLLFRRSTTFGALFCMTVTCNIMAINYCFDVPVKIYSSTLFLMSAYLAAPEIKKLLTFFFYGKTTCLSTVHQPLAKKWQRITAIFLKITVLSYLLITMLSSDFDQMKIYGDGAPTSKLYGYYNVDIFKEKDSLHAPLLSDTARWNKIVFNIYKGANRVTVKKMNDSLVAYDCRIDSLRSSITLMFRNDTIPRDSFYYAFTANNNMELKSRSSDSLFMRLKKIDIKNFPLMSRGYHWINEYPFNR